MSRLSDMPEVRRWLSNVIYAFVNDEPSEPTEGEITGELDALEALLDASRAAPAVPGEPMRSEGAPTPRQLDNAVKFIMGLPGWDQTRLCTCASYPHTEDCGRDPTGAEPGTGKPGGEG